MESVPTLSVVFRVVAPDTPIVPAKVESVPTLNVVFRVVAPDTPIVPAKVESVPTLRVVLRVVAPETPIVPAKVESVPTLSVVLRVVAPDTPIVPAKVELVPTLRVVLRVVASDISTVPAKMVLEPTLKSPFIKVSPTSNPPFVPENTSVVLVASGIKVNLLVLSSNPKKPTLAVVPLCHLNSTPLSLPSFTPSVEESPPKVNTGSSTVVTVELT